MVALEATASPRLVPVPGGSFSGEVLGYGEVGPIPGSLGPSPCPQLQHPGQRLLGAGVDQVGAGSSAEGLPVPAAEGREAVHSHEAFIPLPPVGRDCQPRDRDAGARLLSARGDGA